MHPKAHLISHSRVSDSRWVITISWLSWSLRPFLYSSVYSGYLFLISSLLLDLCHFSPLLCPSLHEIFPCCAKSLQLCPTVQPHGLQPTRLLRLLDSPGKNIGVGCHLLLQCMKVKRESEVAQSCPTLATPWTAAHQAPPSMGFSRQEHWSGVPLPSPCLPKDTLRDEWG